MTAPTKTKPPRNAIRQPLRPGDLEPLGNVGGWTYVTHDDREYLLDRAPMDSADVAQPLRAGEVRFAEPVETVELGTVMRSTRTTRATEVPVGSYAAALEREARTRRILGPAAMRPADRWQRVRGAEQHLAWLRKEAGAELGLTLGGRLTVRTPGGRLTDAVRDFIQDRERLLVGFLTSPLRCELEHQGIAPEAVAASFGVPMCADHADGTA